MIVLTITSLLMITLSACNPISADNDQPATTAQPETTPEIVVPTLSPAGLPGNPLRFVIVPKDPLTAPDHVTALEEAILQASSVTVDIVIAQNNADALLALCNTTPEQVAVAFLDGFAWLVAEAQNCGDAVLRLQATTAPDAPISDPIHILLNDSYRSTDLSILEGRIFCRLGVGHVASWLVPNLIFRNQQINVAVFDAIRDYPDYDALLTALAQGECDGASLPQSLYRAYSDASDERISAARIAQTSVGLPYGVLVYPSQIPLAARLSLTEALLRLFVAARLDEPDAPAQQAETTPEPIIQPDWFTAFFGDYGIGRINENDFSDLRDFITTSNIDLTILGQ